MDAPSGSRVLVLGASGFLGSRLVASDPSIFDPLPLSRINSECDLAELEAVIQVVTAGKEETTVVNCLGSRSGPREEMTLLNATLPKVLGSAADRFGFHLVHLASAAEIVEPLGNNLMTDYQLTKREGTMECLSNANVTVLRIFNIHGLPHQTDSGLHALCASLRSHSRNRKPNAVADTLRDYVHWQEVVRQIAIATKNRPRGLQECATGVGIRISDIVTEFPPGISESLEKSLVAADMYSGAVGTDAVLSDSVPEPKLLAAALAQEVITCASS